MEPCILLSFPIFSSSLFILSFSFVSLFFKKCFAEYFITNIFGKLHKTNRPVYYLQLNPTRFHFVFCQEAESGITQGSVSGLGMKLGWRVHSILQGLVEYQYLAPGHRSPIKGSSLQIHVPQSGRISNAFFSISASLFSLKDQQTALLFKEKWPWNVG